MYQNKQSIRQTIIQQRKQLSHTQQQYASIQIANHLRCSPHFINAQHIAYYLPVSGEADPTSLLQPSIPTIYERKKTFYLPIVAHQENISLLFAKVDQDTRYTTNKYGIKEPIYHTQDLLPANELDMVITPLVSFDQQGNRLGMGGGYYDRTFAFKQQQNAYPDVNVKHTQPFLMGYAYDFQQTTQLQAESWDVPLDGIVTESGLLPIQ